MKKIRRKLLTQFLLGTSLTFVSLTSVEAQTTRQAGSTKRSASSGQNHKSGAQAPDHLFVQQMAEANQAEITLGELALQKATSEQVKTFAHHMITDHTQASTELQAIGQQTSMNREPERGNPNTNNHYGNQSTSSGNTSIDNRTDTVNSESGMGMNGGTNGSEPIGSTDYKGDPSPGKPLPANVKGKGQLASKHQVTMNRLEALSGNEFDQQYIDTQVSSHKETIELFQQEISSGKNAQLRQFAQKNLPLIKKHLQEALAIQTALKSNAAKSGN
jgi:predicted outer membrane protein